MATELELFVGTYEHYLLSYKIKKRDDETFIMERVIATHSHHSSIRCMDVNGKYLATGGTDDRIVIIDLKLNKEVQSINLHKSSVNAISFTSDGSHLLSGSEDGQLLAIKVGSWLEENAWNKPHTGKSILKICIHKSGKVAFTLGKDETLRGWDMIRGRQINTTNVKGLSDAEVILDNVQLSPNGETLAMSGFKTVTVISTVYGKLYDELQLQSKISSLWWIDNENLLIGMEDGGIEWNNIVEAKHKNIPKVHTNRVKDMHYLNGFLVTICSTGDITLWSTSISEKILTQICTINDSCRPTCVKLISTTENRYKGETKIEAVESKEPVVEQLVKSTHVKTAAKVIIEIDGNDDDQSHDVITNKNKKKNKKIRTTSADEDLEIVSNVTPTLTSPINTDANVSGKKQKTPTLESSIKTDGKVNEKKQKTPTFESSIKTNVNVHGKKRKTTTLESPIKTDGKVNGKSQKTQTLEYPINVNEKKQSMKKVAEKKPILTHSANSEDEFDMRDTPKKELKRETSMNVRSSKRKRSVKDFNTIVNPPKENVTPKSNKKFKNRSLNLNETDSLAVEDKRDDVLDPFETDNKSKNGKTSHRKGLMPRAASKNLSLNNLTELVDNNKRKQKQQQSTAASKIKVAKQLNLNEQTRMKTRNNSKRKTM